MMRSAELSDTTDAPAAARGLPVILACAVVQGWALYGLHRAVDADHWPATNAAMLLALYAVAVFVPLTVQLLARHARSLSMWPVVAILTVAFLGFGLHEGAFVHSDATELEATSRLAPLLFVLLLLWFQLLPFVQGRLRTGHWRCGYPVLFATAWQNALVLAEAALFAGLFWLLLFLWQELFALLGIGFFEELFGEPVFVYPVTALVFGVALHLIGSIERLTLAILEQLLNVLKWLGVLGAFILVIFSIALAMKLPGLLATGERAIGAQWLLWLVAVVVLLLNAAYRDGLDPAPYPAWLGKALRLAVPLMVVVSLTAVYALGVRTAQYGLTVERVWAFVVAATALLHSATYTWSAWRGGRWMQGMGRMNVLASIALMTVLALTLTPVLSPGRLAADSQFRQALLPRVPATEDEQRGDPPVRWLRFHGGGYGMARLQELASLETHPDAARIRRQASAALAAKHVADPALAEWQAALDSLVIHPAGRVLEPEIRAAIEAEISKRSSMRAWPAVGAGVYLDLNDDGGEEFLLLVSQSSQFYARTAGEWQYAGTVENVPFSDESWERLLSGITEGRIGTIDQTWNDVLIGTHRLRPIPEQEPRQPRTRRPPP